MPRKLKNKYFLSNPTCKTRIAIIKLRPKPSNHQNTKTPKYLYRSQSIKYQTPNIKTQLRLITIFSWQPNITVDLENPPPSNPTNGLRKSRSTPHCRSDFLDLLSTSTANLTPNLLSTSIVDLHLDYLHHGSKPFHYLYYRSSPPLLICNHHLHYHRSNPSFSLSNPNQTHIGKREKDRNMKENQSRGENENENETHGSVKKEEKEERDTNTHQSVREIIFFWVYLKRKKKRKMNFFYELFIYLLKCLHGI